MRSLTSRYSGSSDEGGVPTRGELGRQVKRLKMSTVFNSVTETLPMVTDDMIGARFARATDLTAEIAVNILGQAPRYCELLNAIRNATQQIIDENCAHGGAFWNLLDTACQPGGLIRACVDAGEQRTMARLHNGKKYGVDELLQPLV